MRHYTQEYLSVHLQFFSLLRSCQKEADDCLKTCRRFADTLFFIRTTRDVPDIYLNPVSKFCSEFVTSKKHGEAGHPQRCMYHQG